MDTDPHVSDRQLLQRIPLRILTVLQFIVALCPIEQQSHLWVSEKGEEKEKEKKVGRKIEKNYLFFRNYDL
jgi:hypothetical protein